MQRPVQIFILAGVFGGASLVLILSLLCLVVGVMR
jgi:hypothetical protein